MFKYLFPCKEPVRFTCFTLSEKRALVSVWFFFSCWKIVVFNQHSPQKREKSLAVRKRQLYDVGQWLADALPARATRFWRAVRFAPLHFHSTFVVCRKTGFGGYFPANEVPAECGDWVASVKVVGGHQSVDSPLPSGSVVSSPIDKV